MRRRIVKIVRLGIAFSLKTAKTGSFVYTVYDDDDNAADGPRFISEPQTQAANVGDDVTLTCHVGGNPTPTVYWRRHGDQRILSRQSTLRLTGVTSDQFTSYTCSASSVGYSTVSRDVHLLRNGTPIIVSSGEQSARHGATASIECLVKAIPPPKTVTWTKNGQPVDFDSMPRYARK